MRTALKIFMSLITLFLAYSIIFPLIYEALSGSNYFEDAYHLIMKITK